MRVGYYTISQTRVQIWGWLTCQNFWYDPNFVIWISMTQGFTRTQLPRCTRSDGTIFFSKESELCIFLNTCNNVRQHCVNVRNPRHCTLNWTRHIRQNSVLCFLNARLNIILPTLSRSTKMASTLQVIERIKIKCACFTFFTRALHTSFPRPTISFLMFLILNPDFV